MKCELKIMNACCRTNDNTSHVLHDIAKPDPENWSRLDCKDCSLFKLCESINNLQTSIESIDDNLSGNDHQSD
jgi:hypothetical protein